MNRVRLGAAGLGVFGLGLRWWMYANNIDEKLLLTATPLNWVLLGLTALAAALGVFAVLKRLPMVKLPSVVSAFGYFLFGAGLLLTAVLLPGGGTAVMQLPARFLCALSGAAMGFGGGQLVKGKPIPFGIHAVTALCLGVLLIYRYQTWSYQSQVMNYVFPLLGCIALCLSVFKYAALDVGMGKLRNLRFLLPVGIFLCLTAAGYEGAWALYLTGGVWLAVSPERTENDDT